MLGDSYSRDRRLPFAIYSFLAEGPRGEVVLIDLGPKSLGYANDMFRRYGFFREKDGARQRPDDIVQEGGNVLEQLKKRGIGPERVDHIIFTHLHADHHGIDDAKDGGAAADFPRATIHVSARGWAENLKRRKPGGGWGSYVDFAFSDFLLSMERKGRCVFRDDAEILPGLRTRFLGGHSPCSQAAIVETAGGAAVIASDEIYHYRLLEEGILARLRVTPEALRDATDILVGLAIDEKAVLLPVHDPALQEAWRKAGERWLEELRPRSDRSAQWYREKRRKGELRGATPP